MMFSGHTAITYLTCPRKYRVYIVMAMMSLLVLIKMHYTSDVLVAVLVSRLIEHELPFESKSKATCEEANS